MAGSEVVNDGYSEDMRDDIAQAEAWVTACHQAIGKYPEGSHEHTVCVATLKRAFAELGGVHAAAACAARPACLSERHLAVLDQVEAYLASMHKAARYQAAIDRMKAQMAFKLS